MDGQSYMNLGPAIPCLLGSANVFSPGDFDGDGRCEVASYSPARNSLNVLSYFRYGDVSDDWSESAPQMISAWSCTAAIPPGAGVTQGWNFQSDDIYFSAKLSGPGAFLVIFNPSEANFGIAQWTGAGMELVFFSHGQTAEYCGLNACDQFFVADVNGDGNDELIQFTYDGQWLFVLQFQAGSTLGSAGTLNYISSSHESVGGWNMRPTDRLLPARVNEGAAEQLVLISTELPLIGVLNFENGSFQGVSFMSRWVISTWLAADADGDGLDELVCFPSAQFAIKWNGATFQFLAGAGDSWDTGANLLLAMKRSGRAALLVAFYPDLSITVAGLEGAALSSLWTQQGSVPGNVALKPSSQFYLADIDGDGDDELVMFSPTDGWLFTIQWSGSQLQAYTSLQSCGPAWSIALFTASPVTPIGLAPIAASLLPDYQTVSSALYKAVPALLQNGNCSSDDIRSCYQYATSADFMALQTKLNGIQTSDSNMQMVVEMLTNDLVYGYICSSIDADCNNDVWSEFKNTSYTNYYSFGDLAARVDQLQAPEPQCWPNAVWTAMQTQLVAQLNGAGSVINWQTSMQKMILQLQVVHDQALNLALTNFNGSAPSPNTQVSSVVADVLAAVFCGAAAVPGFGDVLATGPILLSFIASILPEVYSALAPAPSQPPPAILYSQYAADIDEQFTLATTALTNHVETLLGDSIRLPLVGSLLNGTADNSLWETTEADIEVYVNNNLTPTIVTYYSTFIPMRFNFLVWQKSSTLYYCKSGNFQNPQPTRVPLNPPADTSYAATSNSGESMALLLCVRGGSLGRLSTNPTLSYPSQDLITDLFTTRGVSQAEFFNRQGMWVGISSENADLFC